MLVLRRPRMDSWDEIRLTYAPPPAVPDPLADFLKNRWSKAGIAAPDDIDLATMPVAEWPGRDAQRVTATLHRSDPASRGTPDLGFVGYRILWPGTAEVTIEATTTITPASAFRAEVEAVARSVRAGNPEK